MQRDLLIREMQSILGADGVISEREQLRTYECDGLMNYRVIPDLVVLPESAEQVRQAVKLCHALAYMLETGDCRYSLRCSGDSGARPTSAGRSAGSVTVRPASAAHAPYSARAVFRT